MLKKTPATKRAERRDNLGRVAEWQGITSRLGNVPPDDIIETLGFALVAQDCKGEEWLSKFFTDTLRRRSVRSASRTRGMADDPISTFEDYIRPREFAPALPAIPSTIDPDLGFSPTQKIFEYFGLTPKNPVHRGFLIAILADIYFNSPLQGRPKGTRAKEPIWTEPFLFRLGEALKELEQRHPKASDIKLSKMLKEKFHPQATAETLRKRLSAARHAYERQLSKINR